MSLPTFDDALEMLREAIENEGRCPRLHRRIMRRHRREWPALWIALDRVIAMDKQR